MKRKIILVSILIFILAISFIFISHSIAEKTELEIKSHRAVYCYQEYFGPPNQVLIVEHKDDIPNLVKYYKEMEKGENPLFEFDLKTLSMYEPVYLLSYSEDSLVAEVVSYSDYGKRRGGNYTRGYIYSKTIHASPPKK